MNLKVPNFSPENGSETQTTHRHLRRPEAVKRKDRGAEPVKRREEEVALALAWKWEISSRGKKIVGSGLGWCVAVYPHLSSPSSPGPFEGPASGSTRRSDWNRLRLPRGSRR